MKKATHTGLTRGELAEYAAHSLASSSVSAVRICQVSTSAAPFAPPRRRRSSIHTPEPPWMTKMRAYGGTFVSKKSTCAPDAVKM